MGIPTVTSVAPGMGLTGGRGLVAITGTNFQLPPAPPARGPALVVPAPSVSVLFGTVAAAGVRVLSPTLLHVTSPIHDAGVVDVTVRNVDQAGAVVGSETVTAAGAFTFARPNLNTGPVGESELARLVRTLILELRRQVLDNVELTVSTDYDNTVGDGANVAMLATLPGIVLSGPTLTENRFYSLNQARSVSAGGGHFTQLRPPYTVDLGFTIVGADDNTQRLANLMSAVQLFFHANKVLRMLRDPAVPGDYVVYEMEVVAGGNPKSVAAANNSNIRAFAGSFEVRGLDLDDAMAALLQTTTITDVLPPGFITGLSPGVGPQPSGIILGGTVDPLTGQGVLPTNTIGPAPEQGTGSAEQIEPEE